MNIVKKTACVQANCGGNSCKDCVDIICLKGDSNVSNVCMEYTKCTGCKEVLGRVKAIKNWGIVLLVYFLMIVTNKFDFFLLTFLLLILSVSALVIGIINPSAVILSNNMDNWKRIRVLKHYGLATIILFIMASIAVK